MRFLVDHCVWGKTIKLLKKQGYEVITLKELNKQDAPDQEVIKIAKSKSAILITNDLDFGNIFLYPPSQFGGVIVLRISPEKEDAGHRTLLDYLDRVTQEKISKTLVIVDHQKCRIHR